MMNFAYKRVSININFKVYLSLGKKATTNYKNMLIDFHKIIFKTIVSLFSLTRNNFQINEAGKYVLKN